MYDEFKQANCDILGVSTDSVYSHRAWMNTAIDEGGIGKIKFPLAADTALKASEKYGVLLEDEGIAQRGTFIIDPEGIIRYQLVSDLNVARNADELLRVVHALQTGGLCPIDWDIGDETL